MQEFLKRSRLWLMFALISTIILGLASRKFSYLLPAIFGKYPGDALWALMVLIGLAWLKPDKPIGYLAGLALFIAYAVEISQLYQADWINRIRATTMGHLVLGSAFHYLDLVAYAIGIGMGVLMDKAIAIIHRK